ncbi:MAG: cation:proton antiporter [Actinobacteria bacterium HGW-Actinobacteria-4]|nr:MAG: cation:proton antiporter [Actinobacteria bacterium HGW-Actinobacteria-4]
MTGSLISLLVAVPLLAAGALTMVSRYTRLTIVVLMSVLVAATAGGVVLVIGAVDGTVVAHSVALWPAGIAIPFVVDMFTALMLTVTALLTTVCCVFAIFTGHAARRFFPTLVLVLTAGVSGALMTADLFNMFVFIEVMLLSAYGLLVMSAPGKADLERIKGARLYVTVNLLASTVFLAGVGFMYGVAGTVNIAELAGLASEDTRVAIAGAVCLFALSIKACVVPVHGWLVRTYPVTSPVVTAIFSALHTKVAIYAIYRIYAVIFEGDARFLWVGLLLFSATMIVGVLGAVGETTMRSILAFHMVSQIGYILLGVALFGPLGLAAGIFYQLHHMIVKASLFLSTGAIEVRYGTGTLGKVKGIAKREPLIAVAFFAAALSLAGVPPFSGFVAKLALIMAAIDAGQVAVVIAAIAVSLITLLSMLKIWSEVFWGKQQPGEEAVAATQGPIKVTSGTVAVAEKRRIGAGMIAPSLFLAALTLALGVGAHGLLSLTQIAAAGLVDTAPYIQAVLGS